MADFEPFVVDMFGSSIEFKLGTDFYLLQERMSIRPNGMDPPLFRRVHSKCDEADRVSRLSPIPLNGQQLLEEETGKKSQRGDSPCRRPTTSTITPNACSTSR